MNKLIIKVCIHSLATVMLYFLPDSRVRREVEILGVKKELTQID